MRSNLVSKQLLGVVLAMPLVGACGAVAGQQDQGNQADQVAAALYATKIDGAPAQDQTVAQTSVELRFALDGVELPAGLELQGFECRFEEAGPFAPCDGDPFILSGLKDGAVYTVTVRAVLVSTETGERVYAAEATVKLDVKLDGAVKDGPQGHGIADNLQLGSAYQMKVPEGMHVTEFSSSKTTGVLSVFRILPESDPYYLGNFKCGADWDRVVASVAPSGDPLTYCHSTPRLAQYNHDHEHRLANNHVEIATDTALVADGNHERLTVSVFDADWEFKKSRSRFQRACLNSSKNSMTVPMINDFFLGRLPEEAEFWYCDAYVAGMDGRPELWRIGAFFEGDNLDVQCDDCSSARAVEAVYMVRANAAVFTPAQFAKTAQIRILDVLTKITP